VSTTRRRRFALIALVILAAGGCLALGWWQWTRYESTSGFQNLGYALQWPMFAGFCVYAYRKFVRYEQAPPEQPSSTDTITEIPAGVLPERRTAPTQSGVEDPVMREYNAYLAELAKADEAHDHHQNRTAT
jgi:DNA-binding transcriptional regulator of glucitol operon